MFGLRLGYSVSVQDHGRIQAVVKLIKKLLMSSCSDINGLYSLPPMIWHSVYWIRFFTLKWQQRPPLSIKPPWLLFHKSSQTAFLHICNPWCFLSYQACKGPNDLPLYILMREYICEDKIAGMRCRVVRGSVGPGRQRRRRRRCGLGGGGAVGGWREPCGSLEWCDRLPSLLVGFVGMWERRILAPGEPRQSAADFMPSVSASILSLPNSSDLYFLSLYLLLIPVHKSSGHTEIC